MVVFCGGISPRLESEEMKVTEPGFKGGDRTSIELPQSQREVIAELHRMGKRRGAGEPLDRPSPGA